MPIYFYKGIISPFLPHTCRYYPSCSCYFLSAVEEFGVKGVLIGIKRICRCHPSRKNKNYGYDPIPLNIKVEMKWLL